MKFTIREKLLVRRHDNSRSSLLLCKIGTALLFFILIRFIYIGWMKESFEKHFS